MTNLSHVNLLEGKENNGKMPGGHVLFENEGAAVSGSQLLYLYSATFSYMIIYFAFFVLNLSRI